MTRDEFPGDRDPECALHYSNHDLAVLADLLRRRLAEEIGRMTRAQQEPDGHSELRQAQIEFLQDSVYPVRLLAHEAGIDAMCGVERAEALARVRQWIAAVV